MCITKHRLLSIILPVYNVAQYLPECLQSLQKQKFSSDDVEIIFIDDGSTDGSGQICDEAEDKYGLQTVVVHTENRGIASARNRGLQESKGEYIAWVDPDDYITDDWWQVIKSALVEKPEMICFDVITEKNKSFTENHYMAQSKVLSRKQLMQALARDDMPSVLYSKILKRFFYHECFFDESLPYYEDYDIMHRLAFKVQECVYLRKSLYVYRYRKNSLMHDEMKELIRKRWSIETARKRFQFYHQHNIIIDDFSLARVELQFLYSVFIYSKTFSLEKLRIEYKIMLQHIKQHISYFSFNRSITVYEHCFLYLLFKKKKPFLWILFRHPRCVIKQLYKMMRIMRFKDKNEGE